MLKFFSRLAILLIFSLALVAGAGFGAYHFLPTAPIATDTSVDEDLLADDTYNILLCGVDGSHENADTIVLVSFNTKTQSLRLLSIPRDTMSNVDRFIQKINASYSVDHPGNIEQTIHEVEMVTGLPIDRYAITTFEGFENAINALGGVEMYVPMDLYYSDPYQNLEINIKEGNQVLDGEQALKFVRYREGYASGDLGRIGAQQLFFSALADTFLSPAVITKVPTLAKVVSEDMQTDLTVSEMLWFFKKARGMSLDSIEMFMLPGTPDYINELSYYVPSEAGILELMNSKFMDKGRRLTASDLDLVPMASYASDTTEDYKVPEIIQNGYDNNGSYVGSGQGGTTYEGYGGAYMPPVEQNTGQPSRGSTTDVYPYLPEVDGNGGTIVPSDGSGNTATVQ